MIRKIILVGNGGFASRCLDILEKHPAIREKRAEIVFVVVDESRSYFGNTVVRWCETKKIPYLGSRSFKKDKIIENIQEKGPFDVLISANNFQILDAEWIALSKLAINFHAGPLPKYGGRNTWSWAIYEGEKEFGVTWHVLKKRVDSGEIVAQSRFEIKENDRAGDLILKGMDEGLKLFSQFLSQYFEDKIEFQTQNLKKRTYYTSRMRLNDGMMDLNWSVDQLSRYIRALSFHPFPPEMPSATFFVGDVPLVVQNIEVMPQKMETAKTGEILEVHSSKLTLAWNGGICKIGGIKSLEGEKYSSEFLLQILKPGLVLGIQSQRRSPV